MSRKLADTHKWSSVIYNQIQCEVRMSPGANSHMFLSSCLTGYLLFCPFGDFVRQKMTCSGLSAQPEAQLSSEEALSSEDHV